jgi:DNA primase
VVTPEKNLCHCLGACNTGCSVIDWIIKTRGVSFRHAVELLKADHPSLSAQVERIVRKNAAAKRASPITLDAGNLWVGAVMEQGQSRLSVRGGPLPHGRGS